MKGTTLNVLDHGFVKLIDYMGDDLRCVNAARISFAKIKEQFDDKDDALLKYLAEHEHHSPFRHPQMTFHVKAPIFVFRQLVKHRIGSEINEISGRYVDMSNTDYYVPDSFRKQAVNNKQGSEGQIELNEDAKTIFLNACKYQVEQYKALLTLGVCKEQARALLPVGMYSEIYWTVSLQAIAHFIKLRKDGHAQKEIQDYAIALETIVTQLYPASMKYLMDENNHV